MSRRERLWISVLLFVLATTAAPAHAAEGPWQGLEGVWSWLREVVWQPVEDMAMSEQSWHIDPNGSTTTSDQGPYIDPNG